MTGNVLPLNNVLNVGALCAADAIVFISFRGKISMEAWLSFFMQEISNSVDIGLLIELRTRQKLCGLHRLTRRLPVSFNVRIVVKIS